MSDLAKKAYDAWIAVMSGRYTPGGAAGYSAFAGFPKFEQLQPIERQAWIAAASAVEDAISAERVP